MPTREVPGFPGGEQGDPVGDLPGTAGLLLIVAGVIASALWVSIVGGGYPGGSAAITGVGALVCFAAGVTCLAAPQWWVGAWRHLSGG
jgi:hypothetical protein